MINKALRSQDTDQLERFSFLIVDLENRSKVEHSSSIRQTSTSLFPTYRGVQLRHNEVERLDKNIDRVVCSKGFWSTSRNRGRAITFATRYNHRDDLVNVLFEVICDRNVELLNVICVDISKYSAYFDEMEVLFGLGT